MSEPVVGPSGPRPGVERAIEIIEARLQTWFHAGQPAYNVSGHSLDADCWHCHEAATQAAEAIVAAIPSLDAEALAELVGGRVETGWRYVYLVDGSGSVMDSEQEAIEYADAASTFGSGPVSYHETTRVVTPWRPVTSPEGPRS